MGADSTAQDSNAIRGALLTAVLILLTLVVTGCADFEQRSASYPSDDSEAVGADLLGYWVVTSYTFEGEQHTLNEADLEPGDRSLPWFQFTPDTASGYLGCNSWDAVSWSIEGDHLHLGESMMTAMGCLEATPEEALTAAVWGDGGLLLAIDGPAMTWTNDEVTVHLESRDRRPMPPPSPWPTTFGALDCTPYPVIRHDFLAEGLAIEAVLLAVPSVVTTGEGEQPWTYGYSEDGSLRAMAAVGDITPVPYQREACGDDFGIKAVPLEQALLTWLNELGIGHMYDGMWGRRIVDLCSSLDSEVPALVALWIEEDSLNNHRADGSLPTVEEATSTATTMRNTVCLNPAQSGD